MEEFDGQTREELIDEIKRLRRMRNPEMTSKTREHYASVVLDHMYQFVALLDTNGIVLTANLPALNGAGIGLTDVVSKPFWHSHWWQIDDATPKRIIRDVEETSKSKKFVRYEADIWGSKHGAEVITIDFSLSPVVDENNQVLYLLAEGRNITEKKVAEAQLAQKNKELQVLYERVKELDKLKSQFIANISHELRTPLALILGPAEKMLDLSKVQGDNTLQRNLETVVINAYTLLKHVNDLLDISKLEAGKVELCYCELDFPVLLDRICSHFELQATSRFVEFEQRIEGSWIAQVDADKVERVMLNVLSNAFKFTPEAGQVRVTVRHQDPQPEAPRGLIEIVVEDSGPGISAELWDVIFDRFQQGDGGSTRNHGGTGLGLAIVKELTVLHDGSVAVGSSAELGGALLKIQLPCMAPEGANVVTAFEGHRDLTKNTDMRTRIANFARQTLSELSSHNRPALPHSHGVDLTAERGKATVLVVEDNAVMNQFIAEILQDDYRVIRAHDGVEGLARVIEHRPDCVITDVMMPRMSGDEMVAEIRSKRELDTMPVIMLTAKADDELKVSMLTTGAQDYLSKPFQAMDLLARVNNLVAMRRTWIAMQQALRTQERDLKELIEDISTMFGHDEFMQNLLRARHAQLSDGD